MPSPGDGGGNKRLPRRKSSLKAPPEFSAAAEASAGKKKEEKEKELKTTRTEKKQQRQKELEMEQKQLDDAQKQRERNAALREKTAMEARGAGQARRGKGRATASFLNDPTMQATIDKLNREREAAGLSGPVQEEPELDESELQQLRGVFAAQDADKDGFITKRELKEAILALGFSPTDELMNKYHKLNISKGNNSWKISLDIFLTGSAQFLETADDCSSDLECLFQQFDPDGKGTVTAGTIRHLLHETLSPTRLSRQEMEEFMEYASIIKKKQGYSTKVNYNKLIDKLLFV